MRAQEQGTTAAANQSTPDGPASCGVIEQDSLLSFVASASSQEHTFHLHASPCSPPAARLSGPWLHPPRLGRSVRRRTGDQTGANQCQPVPASASAQRVLLCGQPSLYAHILYERAVCRRRASHLVRSAIEHATLAHGPPPSKQLAGQLAKPCPLYL